VWPDADAPGRQYADDVARLAREAGAATVRVVAVPEPWPQGWDLADALPEGVAQADLLRMVAEASAVPEPARTEAAVLEPARTEAAVLEPARTEAAVPSWPAPLDRAAFIGPLGDFVLAL